MVDKVGLHNLNGLFVADTLPCRPTLRDILAVYPALFLDSTPRYVGPSVRWLVGRSGGPLITFFGVFELFKHTAPALMP